MGDTWMILDKHQTTRRYIVKEIDHDGEEYEYERELHERCNFCWATDCVLYGKYGTYNEYGSFCGVCDDCLEKLNALASIYLLGELHKKIMEQIDNAPEDISFNAKQKKFISEIFKESEISLEEEVI